MPKLKYYNDTQRSEAKQLGMLKAQTDRRIKNLRLLGGRCLKCNNDDLDVLVISNREGLYCANCLQKENTVEARDRFTRRSATLQQCRLDSWKQQTAIQPEDLEPLEESPAEHSIRIAAELQVLQARRAQEIQAQLDEQQEEEDKYTAKAKQKWIEENGSEKTCQTVTTNPE